MFTRDYEMPDSGSQISDSTPPCFLPENYAFEHEMLDLYTLKALLA